MAKLAPKQTQPDVRGEKVQPQRELKHLDFLYLGALQMVAWLSSLYGFAKDSSGPLKPGIQAVEGGVKAVVSPVYNRFHGVPFEVLKFIDQKVDGLIGELERLVPPAMKAAVTQAYTAAQKAPEIARLVIDDVQRGGVVGTATALAKSMAAECQPAAKQLYARYEPVAEKYAVDAWHALNRLPLFPQVVRMAVPTAAHLADRYNAAVRYGAENGYAMAAYLPLVPKERIAKVFASGRSEAAAKAE